MCSRALRIVSGSWLCAYGLLVCRVAFAADELPPSTRVLNRAPAELTLYLDLTVNGEPAGKIVPVRQIGEDFLVRIEDLRAAGVAVPEAAHVDASWLSLSHTQGVQHRYDANALLLDVTVPANWFAEQRLSANRQSALHAVSHNGLSLNYSAHVSDAGNGATIGALWTELRAFSGAGVLTHTGVHRYIDESGAWSRNGGRQQGYIRFDTAWSVSNEERLHTWTIGDLITSSQSWGTPVRLAGFKFSRDFRLRPDVITYPLPEFSGQASLPSTLDLYINGQRVRSEQLRPGPYTVSSIPFVSGAGEASLVTTDVLGRQVVMTLPFYASSELLRAGLADYSVSFGAMRREYGIENFSYGRFASAASLRYGLTNALTLEGQVELAPTATSSFGMLGLGAVMNVGMLGTVSGSASRSALDDDRGWQWSFGYRYTNRGMSFSYQGTRSTSDFYSLADIADSGQRGAMSSDIVTVGWSSGRFGSTSVSYVRLEASGDAPASYLNVSYSKSLSHALNLRIGLSRDLERNEGMFSAHLFTSFGARGNVAIGTEHGDSSREYIRYARSIPSQGGIGWNVGHMSNADGGTRTDASLAFGGRYAHVEAGIAADDAHKIGWADLRGSLLVIGNDLFAARQVSDAFVVVSTNGIEGIPVRYENQLVGYTNRRGRLLVPWVTSHYPAKFSIDPRQLPPEVVLAEAEQRLAVKRRSGAVLSFALDRTRSALIRLVKPDGTVLPVGGQAQERRSGQTGTVGYDGLVYFENLSPHLEIEVRYPDGGGCRAALELESPLEGFEQLGPVTCEDTP